MGEHLSAPFAQQQEVLPPLCRNVHGKMISGMEGGMKAHLQDLNYDMLPRGNQFGKWDGIGLGGWRGMSLDTKVTCTLAALAG